MSVLSSRKPRAEKRADASAGCAEAKVDFGYQRVSPAEKTAQVERVFSSVADKYDVMNDVMSLGLHRRWKSHFVRRLAPRHGEAILDMAGGTGDIALRLARYGACVTIADINPDMLAVGQQRVATRAEHASEDYRKALAAMRWCEENAEAVTFAEQSFSAYSIAFGIRNVTHIDSALAEAWRVLRYGGRFFCLEFSRTEWAGFAEIYDLYSHHLVPRMGKAIAKDEDSYRYLIESIRRFPSAPQFASMIAEAGFSKINVEPILGGLVAIHSGWKI